MKLRWTLSNTVVGDLTLGTDTDSNDPAGWKELELRLKRSTRYKGLFHEFSLPIKFYRDSGKAWIDNVYQTQGFEAVVTVALEYWEAEYVSLLSGRMNLSSYKSDRLYTEVNLENNDIAQRLLNRETLRVDLLRADTIDGQALNTYSFAPYDLTLHSKLIYLASGIADAGGSRTVSTSYTSPGNALKRGFVTHQWPQDMGDLKEMASVTTVGNFGKNLSLANSNLQHIYRADDDLIQWPQAIDIEFNFSGTYSDADALARSRICQYVSLNIAWGEALDSKNLQTLNLGQLDGLGYLTSLALFQDTFDITGTTSITLNKGDQVWLYWFVGPYTVTTSGTGDINYTWDYITAFLNLTVSSTTDPSTCKAFPIFEAWARLTEIITDNPDPCIDSNFFGRLNSDPQSYYANGCGAFTALTSGYQIRKFEEKGIHVSLQELFDTCNALFGIGIQAEDTVIRVEDNAYFFGSTVLHTFTNIRDVELTIASEWIFNKVQAGFASWEGERVAGLDEFLVARQYGNNITNIDNELELTSPSICSGYAIEVTRRQLITSDQTKDWRYDDDSFVIALARDLYFDQPLLTDSEKDENFTSVTGIISPETAYNLRFSIARNLIRNMDYIGSSLTFWPGALLRVTEREANTLLVSQSALSECPGDYSGASIADIDDIQFDDANIELSTSLFIPELYRFSSSLKPSEWLTIKANPGAVIAFTYNGEARQGYLLESSYKLHTGEVILTLLRRNV